MKRLNVVMLAIIVTVVLLFSGCAVITNIFDPLPDEYKDGVDFSRDYPDDELELYDDALVFEADEEEDEEITLKYGSEDELDDLIDFYEDMFDDNELTVDETDEGKDDYHAEGSGDGFKFEIDIEEASGDYETRVFKTVVEVTIEFYEVGEETLQNMQGFWLICGLAGEISDEYRMSGQAMVVDGMKVTFYRDFEVDTTDNDFSFDDDDTIRYVDDGEEQTSDVTFETIDGIEYMVVSEGGVSVYLERSSESEMMFYYVEKEMGADILEKLEGFWLACGYEDEIGDEYRQAGKAIEFYSTYMDFYDNFESDSYGNEFTFVDDDTIHYIEDGDEYIIDITFETIDGMEYLVMTNEGVSVYLEPSSYSDMFMYQTASTGDLVYLNDDLSDADLEYYISDIEWYLTYIYYPDGSYEFSETYNRILFDYYYTGECDTDENSFEITWYIYDSIIYIDFGNDYTETYLVDYESDGTDAYLYLFDAELGYDDYALVYIPG